MLKTLGILNGFWGMNPNEAIVLLDSNVIIEFGMADYNGKNSFIVQSHHSIVVKLPCFQLDVFFVVFDQRCVQVKYVILRVID